MTIKDSAFSASLAVAAGALGGYSLDTQQWTWAGIAGALVFVMAVWPCLRGMEDK